MLFAKTPLKPSWPFLLSESPQSRGLVGYWPGGNGSGPKLLDVSRRNNHGTLTNFAMSNTSGWAPGNGGGRGALIFDGTNDYVRAAGVTWTPSAFSASVWINPVALRNYDYILSGENDWGSFVFHMDSGGGVYVGTSIATRFTPSDLPSGTIATGVWQHFVYTYDGSQGRFYKNGLLLAGPKTQTSSTAWGGLMIGFNVTNPYYFSGTLEDTRIYNRKLSAAEVYSMWHPATRWSLRRLAHQPKLLGTEMVPASSVGGGGVSRSRIFTGF